MEPPDYSDQQLRNFRNGAIGGSERGAYARLLSGSDPGRVFRANGFLITQHTGGAPTVPITVDKVRRYISRADNFERMSTHRLQIVINYFFQLQRFLHANPNAISRAHLHAYFDALDDEVDELITAFERGFKDRVLVETGDLSNDFRLAKGVTALDQIRQLADQDYNEYTPQQIMRCTGVIRGEIEQLRETFKR